MSVVRRTETWEIVKNLVDEMQPFIDGGANQWIDNGDGTQTLNVCNTYWVEFMTEIEISAIMYPIASVVKDTSITITGSRPFDNKFKVVKPTFYSGTIKQTNLELSQDNKDVLERSPMAYLFRDIEDTFLPLDSFIERETSIRLFFLSSENFEDFTAEKNSEESLEPLRQLAYYFIDEVVKKSKLIGRIESSYNVRDYSKFGTEDANGYVNNIFNDQLSGVEVAITLPIKRDETCGC